MTSSVEEVLPSLGACIVVGLVWESSPRCTPRVHLSSELRAAVRQATVLEGLSNDCVGRGINLDRGCVAVIPNGDFVKAIWGALRDNEAKSGGRNQGEKGEEGFELDFGSQ